MTYPPPPWHLQGDAVLALRLVDIHRARKIIPAPLKIVPVLPGKTLGIVYFGNYQPGSSLFYYELIVAPAVVRLGRHIGFWISHIYVTHPDSLAGGREVWGLPKEPARFDWWHLNQGRVAAWQVDRLLCAFNSRPPAWSLPMAAWLPVISLLGRQALAFSGTMTARMGLSRGSIEIPAASPFADLGLGGPAAAFHFQRMAFVAHAPQVVG